MSIEVYEKFDNATKNIATHVVIDKFGQYVARIVIVTSASGATVTAYVHWIGTRMSMGKARGSGYNRHNVAVAEAAQNFMEKSKDERFGQELAFWEACAEYGGYGFTHNLREAGFQVFDIM